MTFLSLPLAARDRQEREINIAFLILAVLIACAYYPALNAAWYIDDSAYFTANAKVHLTSISLTNLVQVFIDGGRRPLSALSFALNHACFGLSSWWFHLVNVIIHFLTAVALFHLFLRVLRLPQFRESFSEYGPRIALGGAALWALHPLQVTAVTYGCQRMTSLCALFFIISIIFYLKGRTEPSRHQGLAHFLTCGLAGVIAFGFKENAILIPLALCVIELILLKQASARAMKTGLALFLGFAVLMGVAYMLIIPEGRTVPAMYDLRSFSLLERLLAQPRVLAFHLSQILLPLPGRFSLQHDIPMTISLFSPWTCWGSILFLATLGVTALFKARKWPFFATAILFFFACHLLESTILPLEIIFEHRNYLPSIFIYLFLAVGAYSLLAGFFQPARAARVFSVACLVLAVVLGKVTMDRNIVFQNPVLLWNTALEKAPEVKRVNGNLALVLMRLGRYEDAKGFFLRAINLGAPMGKDRYAVSYLNLAMMLLNNNMDHNLAMDCLHVVNVLDPLNPSAQLILGEESIRLGWNAKALHHAKRALLYSSNKYGPYYLAAQALLQEHLHDQALVIAKRALNREPTLPWTYLLIGEIYRAKGDLPMARRILEHSLFIDPNSAQTMLALMLIARDTGDQELFVSTRERFDILIQTWTPSEVIDRLHELPEGPILSVPGDELKALFPEQQDLTAPGDSPSTE